MRESLALLSVLLLCVDFSSSYYAEGLLASMLASARGPGVSAPEIEFIRPDVTDNCCCPLTLAEGEECHPSQGLPTCDRVLIDNVVEQNCRRQNEEEFTNDCKEYCVPTKSDRFGPCKKHSDCNMWPCSAGPNKPGVNLKCVKGGELCKKKINYDDCCDAPCTYNNLDSLNWASGIWNSFTCVSDYYCEGDDLCENKNCPSKAYHDTWML